MKLPFSLLATAKELAKSFSDAPGLEVQLLRTCGQSGEVGPPPAAAPSSAYAAADSGAWRGRARARTALVTLSLVTGCRVMLFMATWERRPRSLVRRRVRPTRWLWDSGRQEISHAFLPDAKCLPWRTTAKAPDPARRARVRENSYGDQPDDALIRGCPTRTRTGTIRRRPGVLQGAAAAYRCSLQRWSSSLALVPARSSKHRV